MCSQVHVKGKNNIFRASCFDLHDVKGSLYVRLQGVPLTEELWCSRTQCAVEFQDCLGALYRVVAAVQETSQQVHV